MDLDDTPELADFRVRTRAWLDRNRDHSPERPGGGTGTAADRLAAHRQWQRRLAEGGLVAVTWPKAYGGQGLGPMEQIIINQEIARAGVPGILDAIGVEMLGPTLIAHGSDQQRLRYLAPMLMADEVWCQLFSEPSAGSDLAGIQTRARQLDDGSWVLSGQKVWTTNAQIASFGMLLARTDADVPKHKGLTMFIVPMDASGVTVSGLRQISGEAEFNEVFLDDVQLEPLATVGGIGNGWRVALTTLMHERAVIGANAEAFGYTAERFAAGIASDPAALRNPAVRGRLGEIAAELLAVRYYGYRAITDLQRGQIPGPEAGLAKVTTVNAASAGAALMVDVLGPDALSEGNEWAHLTSYMPGLRSAGGTEQILRTMVAERVLGLPAEPRVDKTAPFSEVRKLQTQSEAR